MRRGVYLALLALACWFGWQLRYQGWQIAWHIAHRDELVLKETVYRVPMQWCIERYLETEISSGAILQYAPLSLRKVKNTTVTVADRGQHQPEVFNDNYVTSLRRAFANGKPVTERRFHTDFQDAICLEGTSPEFPNELLAKCLGSSGTYSLFTGDPDLINEYYAILKSAHSR
jgi:hypothetical protein